MALLSDAQKQALFGRLLGVPDQGIAANAPERVAPTGTVVGTAPGFVAQVTQNRTIMIIGAVLLVAAVVYAAKKL